MFLKEPLRAQAYRGFEEYRGFEDAIQHEDYDAAIAQLMKAIEKNPNLGNAWVDLGWCYMKKKNYENALDFFDKAEQKGFTFAELYLNRSFVYSELSKNDKAEQDLQTLLKKYPNDPGARLNLSSFYFKNGRYPEALKFYQDHLHLFPDDLEALLAYLAMCLEVDSLPEVAKVFSSVMEYRKENIAATRSFLSYVSQKQSTKQVDELLKELRRYAQISHIPEEEVLILIELGMNAAYRAEFENALNLLQEAEKIAETEMCQRELGYVLNSKGSVHDLLKQHDVAIKEYDQALKLAEKVRDPKLLAYVLNNFGGLMKDAKEWEKAEQVFLNLVSLCEKIKDEEGLMYAYNHLAELYLLQQNLKEAKKYGTLGFSIAKARSNIHEITRSSFILARLDASELDNNAANARLDYVESLAVSQDNELDIFHFLIFRAQFNFQIKAIEKAKTTLTRAIDILGEWIEDNPDPDKFNLNLLNRVLNDQMSKLENLLNDPNVPEEEKCEMLFVIKRACEIVQKDPKKLEDPKIASKIPQFMRQTFQHSQELKNQVTGLTNTIAKLEEQIEELRKRPRTLKETTESEDYWKKTLGEATWSWLDLNNREELIFSHQCMSEAKINARFYKVSMRSLALVVEDEFNTKFHPIIMPRKNLIPEISTVPKKYHKTIGELIKTTNSSETVSLGTIPFVLSAISEEKHPLHSTALFLDLCEFWKGQLKILEDIVIVLNSIIGDVPDARSYVKYRNLDAHTTRFACSEKLLLIYQKSTTEILNHFRAIFT